LYPGIEHVDAHAEAPETQKPTTHETSDREFFKLELIRNTFLYLWDKTKWSESIQSLNLTHSKRGIWTAPSYNRFVIRFLQNRITEA